MVSVFLKNCFVSNDVSESCRSKSVFLSDDCEPACDLLFFSYSPISSVRMARNNTINRALSFSMDAVLCGQLGSHWQFSGEPRLRYHTPHTAQPANNQDRRPDVAKRFANVGGRADCPNRNCSNWATCAKPCPGDLLRVIYRAQT